MGAYAYGTSVSVEKSKTEIERILRRYGAKEFMYGWNDKGVIVGFGAQRRRIRITVPIPPEESYRQTPTGKKRSESSARFEYESEERRRWRALVLMIKAKLEAVESGIATFENEFLPYTIMGNNETVGEWAVSQLDKLAEGDLPPLLPQGAAS